MTSNSWYKMVKDDRELPLPTKLKNPLLTTGGIYTVYTIHPSSASFSSPPLLLKALWTRRVVPKPPHRRRRTSAACRASSRPTSARCWLSARPSGARTTRPTRRQSVRPGAAPRRAVRDCFCRRCRRSARRRSGPRSFPKECGEREEQQR